MLKNQIKTFLLLALLTALLLGAGQLIGGRSGLIIGMFFALAINFFSYWYGDKIVLAMYKAKEAPRERYPALHKDVEEICKSADIAKPKIYLLPVQASNAFATGRSPSHSSIAVTEGILKQLSRQEFKGVLAHEVSHIKNRDILIATVAATIAGFISYLAFVARYAAIFGGRGGGGSRDDERGNIIGLLALAILAPIAALLIQLAISRSREYIADERGARMLNDPIPLANALLKIDKAAKERPLHCGNEATAHLFIVNPFSAGGFARLFSTHPPIESRIKRLRELKL